MGYGETKDVLALGLGIAPPWRLVGQRLDTDKRPNELHLEVAAERGARFACPDCGRLCKAHDFAAFSWRHLNFFQHHCYIATTVPRTGPRGQVYPCALGARRQPLHALVRATSSRTANVWNWLQAEVPERPL